LETTSKIKAHRAWHKKIRWCSPKYAELDKTEIDVKESEIESFQMVQQLF
jgi:hypothetical protein